MTGAEVLVDMLLAYGVEVVFGVPGDTSLPLYEALHEAAPAIRHIMARDERSAAFMAEAYARLTSKPGVCECPSGAGALYSVPGVAEANASSIPVILLTSGVSLAGEGKGTITELDHHKLYEPITKWSSFLKQIEKIPETVRRAFRIATTGRPGAVHLAFPAEVMSGRWNGGGAQVYAEEECRNYPAYRTRASAAQVRRLAETLAVAERPLLVIGGGAVHSQAGPLVLKLAETLGAPVVTTISGQGIMPDEHPLALGVIGDNGYHPHAHRAVDEADTLLYVGCKLGSVSTIKWSKPHPETDQRILQIDIDPTMLSNNYHNFLSLAGDAALVLEDVLVVLGCSTKPRTPSDWVEGLNRERAEFWLAAQAEMESEAVPLKAQRVVQALNRRLSDPAVVIADAGTPTPYITRFLRLRGPESRFIIPRSYGGLGYAIPAAVGAWLARPQARIVGLFGDGSLGMSAGELETVARLGAPVVLLHFSNGCFGWIKALQRLHSQEKYFSVDFSFGDMTLLAESFGLPARRVTNTSELEDGLDEAFAAEGPFFLDIVTESEVTELPPVYSWRRALERCAKGE